MAAHLERAALVFLLLCVTTCDCLNVFVRNPTGSFDGGAHQSLPYANPGKFSSDYIPLSRGNLNVWRDTLYTNTIWMFSGQSPGGEQRDLWAYDLVLDQWALVGGSLPSLPCCAPSDLTALNSAAVGSTTSLWPLARYGATTWASETHPGQAYMYGGFATTDYVFTDFWEFNSTSLAWTFWGGSTSSTDCAPYCSSNVAPGIFSSSNRPDGRCYAGSTLLNGVYYLFGGRSVSASVTHTYSDIWAFTKTPGSPPAWQRIYPANPAASAADINSDSCGALGVEAASNHPSSMQSTALTADLATRDSIWTYGGSVTGKGDITNVYRYNLTSGLWACITHDDTGAVYTPSPPNVAGGRPNPASINNNLIALPTVPGIFYVEDAGNLWALVKATSTWVWLGGQGSGQDAGTPAIGGPFSASNVQYYVYSANKLRAPDNAITKIMGHCAFLPYCVVSNTLITQWSVFVPSWVQQPNTTDAGMALFPHPVISVVALPTAYTQPVNGLTATLTVVGADPSVSYAFNSVPVVNGVANFTGMIIFRGIANIRLQLDLGTGGNYDIYSAPFDLECSAGCAECYRPGLHYPNQCFVCDPATHLVDAANSSCVTACGSNEFRVETPYPHCVACNVACGTCLSPGIIYPTNCQTCNEAGGYLISLQSTCVLSCPMIGYYPNRIVSPHACSACAFGCSMCSGPSLSSTDCQACAEPSFVRDGSGTCVDTCPAGEFRNLNRSPASCSPCATGCAACFANDTGPSCSLCDEAAGYVRSRGGICTTACASGEYADLIANPRVCAVCTSACLTCTDGTAACDSCNVDNGFARDTLSGSCVKPCPVGYMVSAANPAVCAAVTCQPPTDRNSSMCLAEAAFGDNCSMSCLDGSIGVPALATCSQPTPNEQGAYANTPNCVACAAGSYARSGDIQCQKCIFGVTGEPGASDVSECLCAQGYYEADPLLPGICSPCVEGAVCPGGRERPYSASGYYMSGAVFIPCAPSSACTGNNTCSSGYAGYLCGDCVTGFYHIDRQCESCSSATELKVAVGVVLASLACLFLITVAIPLEYGHDGYAFASPSLALSFVQITATFLQIHLYWPDQLLQLLIAFSALNLNIDIISPECLVAFSFYDKLKVELLVPIAVFGLFLLVFAAYNTYVWARAKDRDAAWRGTLDAFWTVSAGFLFFLCLAYTFLAQTSLQLFACVDRPDGKVTLAASQTTPCYDAVWYSNLPLALTGIAVYIVIIPILLIVVYRRLAKTNGEMVARAHPLMNFAIAKYRPKYWYFEVVTIIRKLLLVGISTFLVKDPITSAILCGIVLMCTLLMSVALRPFVWDKHDIADTASSFGSLMVLMIGVLATTSAINDNIRQLLGTLAVGVAIIIGLILLATFLLEAWVRYRVYIIERTEHSLTSKWASVDTTQPVVSIARVGERLLVATAGSIVDWPAVTVSGYERTPTQVVAVGEGSAVVGICTIGRVQQVLLVTHSTGLVVYDRDLTSSTTVPLPTEISGALACWTQAPRFIATAHTDEGRSHVVVWPLQLDEAGVATIGTPLVAVLPSPATLICAVNDHMFICTRDGEILRAAHKPDQPSQSPRVQVLLRPHRGMKISSIAATPKVLLLASGFVVQGISLSTGEVVMNLPGHRGDACHVSVSAGKIFTGTWTGAVRAWDSTDGKFIERNLTQKHAVRQLHAYGDMVYTADATGAITGWKLMGARAPEHLDPIHACMQRRRANYRVTPGPALMEMVGMRPNSTADGVPDDDEVFTAPRGADYEVVSMLDDIDNEGWLESAATAAVEAEGMSVASIPSPTLGTDDEPRPLSEGPATPADVELFGSITNGSTPMRPSTSFNRSTSRLGRTT